MKQRGRSRLGELGVCVIVITIGMVFLIMLRLLFDKLGKYEGVVNPNPCNIPIIKYYKDFVYLTPDKMLFTAVLTLELIVLSILLIRWLIIKRPKKIKEIYWSKLPDELPPFAVKWLLEKDAVGADVCIASEIAFFIERGYIRAIKRDGEFIIKFIRMPTRDDNLWKYQRTIFDLLYYEIAGADKVLTMDDMKKISSGDTRSNVIIQKMFLIPIDIESELKDKGYTKENVSYSNLNSIIFLIMISSIPFLIKMIISGYIFTNELIISIYIVAFLMLKFSKKDIMKKFTEKGRESYENWRSFNLFLENYSMLNDRGIDDIILWRKFLVYGTALGLSEKLATEVDDLGIRYLFKEILKALATGNIQLFKSK